MVEAGGQYPRWRGGAPLRSGTAIHVIAFQEIRKASRDWAFIIGAAVALALGSNAVFNLAGDDFHTQAELLQAMERSIWAAVAVSAALAGPSLVDDMRRNALDLYLTHGIGRGEYLLGKIAASFGLSFLAVAVTGFLYYGATLVLFEEHPDHWGFVPLGILATAIIWGLLVSGVSMAVASLTKSSRVALLTFIGIFLVFGFLLPWLLEDIVGSGYIWILSPMMAMLSQAPWLFRFTPAGVEFPSWWGLLEVIALIVVSWTIFLARRPRPRGEGRRRRQAAAPQEPPLETTGGETHGEGE